MAGHCDNVHLYFLSLPPNSFAIFMELHVFFFYPRIKIFQQKKKKKEKEEKTNENRLVASRFFMESAIVWRAIGWQSGREGSRDREDTQSPSGLPGGPRESC